jgi:hypothetical protein
LRSTSSARSSPACNALTAPSLAITLNSAEYARRARPTLSWPLQSTTKSTAEYPDEAGHVVATADGFRVLITDAEGRTLADDVVAGARTPVSRSTRRPTPTTGNIFVSSVSRKPRLRKTASSSSPTKTVRTTKVSTTTRSPAAKFRWAEDAYAEDLVVDFAVRRHADRRRPGVHASRSSNLTTQDTVTVNVNGVTYTLTVGVALNGSLIDGEDTRHFNLSRQVQTAFLDAPRRVHQLVHGRRHGRRPGQRLDGHHCDRLQR